MSPSTFGVTAAKAAGGGATAATRIHRLHPRRRGSLDRRTSILPPRPNRPEPRAALPPAPSISSTSRIRPNFHCLVGGVPFRRNSAGAGVIELEEQLERLPQLARVGGRGAGGLDNLGLGLVADGREALHEAGGADAGVQLGRVPPAAARFHLLVFILQVRARLPVFHHLVGSGWGHSSEEEWRFTAEDPRPSSQAGGLWQASESKSGGYGVARKKNPSERATRKAPFGFREQSGAESAWGNGRKGACVRGLALFGFGLWGRRRREGETESGREIVRPAGGVVSRFVAGRRDTPARPPSFAEADAHPTDSTRSAWQEEVGAFRMVGTDGMVLAYGLPRRAWPGRSQDSRHRINSGPLRLPRWATRLRQVVAGGTYAACVIHCSG
jgi:hypothetical protein